MDFLLQLEFWQKLLLFLVSEGVIPLCLIAAAIATLPSFRWLFIPLNCVAFILIIYFTSWRPGFYFFCAGLLVAVVVAPRVAMLVVYAAVGAMNLTALANVMMLPPGKSVFIPVGVAGALLGLALGRWHSRKSRKQCMARHGRMVCAALGALVLLGNMMQHYSQDIANGVAQLDSPAVSGFFMRLGVIPGEQAEDALFMQAKAQSEEKAFLRTMLASRTGDSPKPQRVKTIFCKLLHGYNSPELAEFGLLVLLELPQYAGEAGGLNVRLVRELGEVDGMQPLLHKHDLAAE